MPTSTSFRTETFLFSLSLLSPPSLVKFFSNDTRGRSIHVTCISNDRRDTSLQKRVPVVYLYPFEDIIGSKLKVSFFFLRTRPWKRRAGNNGKVAKNFSSFLRALEPIITVLIVFSFSLIVSSFPFFFFDGFFEKSIEKKEIVGGIDETDTTKDRILVKKMRRGLKRKLSSREFS